MPSTTIMLSVGKLVISVLGGILFYYMLDPGEKKDKKYQLDQTLNVIIQFVLYLWAAKIVFQLERLIHDPMSVLAYPSNSTHFFIATIALLVHVVIKYRKDRVKAANLFQTCSFVLLVALLWYDFLQLIADRNAYLNVMTILLSVLVVIYVLWYTKYNVRLLGSLLTGGFLIAACIIAFYKGYFMVFGYALTPYYFLLLIILLFLYSYRLYKHKLLT